MVCRAMRLLSDNLITLNLITCGEATIACGTAAISESVGLTADILIVGFTQEMQLGKVAEIG